jgi:hypothetical protein
MNSYLSVKISEFDDCFRKLEKDIQKAIIESYEKWKINPQLVGFKQLKNSNQDIYSAKIFTKYGEYRSLAKKVSLEGKTAFVWFWVGSHEDYNKKIQARRIHDLNKIKTTIGTIRQEAMNNANKNGNNIEDKNKPPVKK